MPRQFPLVLIALALGAACGTPVQEAGTGGTTSAGSTTSGATTSTSSTSTGSTTSASSSTSSTSSTSSSTSSSTTTTTTTTTGTTGSTTTGGRDAGFAPAPHSAFPEIPNNGGATVGTVQLVTISFPGDLFDLPAYADVLLASAWFPVVAADYGITAGMRLASYTFPDAGPAVEDQVNTVAFLGGLLDAGVLPLSTADTIYVIQYPPETLVTSAAGQSCMQFGGYHDSLTLWDGSPVTYAVIPACTDAQARKSFGAPNAKTLAEAATSHEVMEAATDPQPTGSPGWQWSQNNSAVADYLAYLVQGSSEVGDPCIGLAEVALDGGFFAQRMWSNSAALAATSSPCIPIPAGEIYYNVSAPATLLTAAANQATDQTLTVTLSGWSSAATSSWETGANTVGGTFDTHPTLPGSTMGYVTMRNGGSVVLSLTVPANSAAQSYSSILLVSTRQADYPRYQTLPLLVLVQ